MYILGINSAYHESAVCLLKDGVIVAAAEEERFTRMKHGKASAVDNPDELPLQALDYCLHSEGLALKDIAHIGFSLNPHKRRQNAAFRDRVIEGQWGSLTGEERFFHKVCSIPEKLEAQGFNVEFTWIDYHLCHAASAFFPSPFSAAAILTVDGIGETTSTAFGLGEGNAIRLFQEISYPASLGFLWEKISKFLGFTEYDAYKIMGLAPYGTPETYIERIRQVVRPVPDGSFEIDNDILRFRVEEYAPLENLFGVKKREHGQPLLAAHQAIAASLQCITNEVVLHMITHLHNQTQIENLCMAGGVALNCVSNRYVYERGPFKHLYIQPAAHDAGTAIGAACFIWNQALGNAARAPMRHAYLGPAFSADDIEQALQANGLAYACDNHLEQRVAALLSQGKIVGWFQNSMEIGPRALGNRSLLADPRNPQVPAILNARIKHWEAFRPFAPSILIEEACHWFQIAKPTLASNFMLMAYPAEDAVKASIPAVLHIDGTGRIQTVRQETNPRFHALIAAFYDITGVPLLLNTSFNDNEPIICTPSHAIHTFLSTEIDCLAIGDFLVTRKNGEHQA